MAFDLTLFAPQVHDRAAEWTALGLTWRVAPIDPNHGKAVTTAAFEGPEWLASVTIWETGEAEVETVRLDDEQVVNKHYDLDTTSDLETLIAELVRLLRDGVPPPGAYIP